MPYTPDDLDPRYRQLIRRLPLLVSNSQQGFYTGLLTAAARRIAIEGISQAAVVEVIDVSIIPSIYGVAEEIASAYGLMLPIDYHASRQVGQIWFCSNGEVAREIRELVTQVRDVPSYILGIARLCKFHERHTTYHITAARREG